MKKETIKKEEYTLSPQQKRELKKITTLSPNFKAQGKLGEFFDLYLVCESTAKKFLEFTGYKTYQVNSIQKIIEKYFPNSIDKKQIESIFKGGEGTRNSKSCRQLRNEYLHQLSIKGRTEIENRIEELSDNMNKWIVLFEI